MKDLLRLLLQGELPTGYQGRDWERLLGQARQARLLGRLACRMEDQGLMPRLPAPVRTALQASLRVLDRHGHEVRHELLAVREALQPLGQPVLLLKGAAYLLAGLPPARGRIFSDIDLLVPEARLGAVESALMARGWISEERQAYNQRYYRQWMHEIPPLRHVQRGSVLDVHHALAPRSSRFHTPGAELIAASQPLAASGFRLLQPTDLVLHSALHLCLDGEMDHAWRDLLDLHDLLGLLPAEGGAAALLERAAQLRLLQVLAQALAPLCTLLPAHRLLQDLASGLDRAEPGWRQRPEARWMGIALGLEETASPARRRRACLRLYWRAHLLRMPLRLLLPHLLRKSWMGLRERFAKAPQP
ncbi:nucleotidyltransferase family protein [Mitsuaria sp. WAJ17]|uniref:nucleotidyltransferase domain-containing protein n=1 Tax=Mitsuaria sp. WAJ17 TaxID=2761452 RepID=UPI00160322D9|nr:nucleotidyltransferase family protein [Mitsuaria sp. WAJ17]MBB2487305.1 nucleotidyltransferase family protein [Mitsuaria sp. WAJ17]